MLEMIFAFDMVYVIFLMMTTFVRTRTNGIPCVPSQLKKVVDSFATQIYRQRDLVLDVTDDVVAGYVGDKVLAGVPSVHRCIGAFILSLRFFHGKKVKPDAEKVVQTLSSSSFEAMLVIVPKSPLPCVVEVTVILVVWDADEN
eukprot:Nitzschia sp. Nitz4//scaffold591_size2607//1358//1786//NITZ4_009286-RA/size2607-processed-gene-0.0-mRNA-1//-1//CDS//3329555057//6259//frame0